MFITTTFFFIKSISHIIINSVKLQFIIFLLNLVPGLFVKEYDEKRRNKEKKRKKKAFN